MASLGRPKIIYTNLGEFLKRNSQLPVYAATLEGVPLKSVKAHKDMILIIGNEANGISEELLKKKILKKLTKIYRHYSLPI